MRQATAGISDPEVTARFRKAVNDPLPAELQVVKATLDEQLLNLRRRGEAKGGLPRLERRSAGCGPVGLR